MNADTRIAGPRLTLGQKIAAGYALPLLILLAVGVLSYRGLASAVAAAELRAHTYQVLYQLAQLETELADAQRAVRGYVLTEQDRYLGPYHEAVKNVPALVAEVQQLTRDNPRQQQRIPELQSLFRAQFDEMERVIALQQKEGNKVAVEQVRTGRGHEGMTRIKALLGEMEKDEEQLLKERDTAADAATLLARWTIIGGTAGAAVLVLLTAFVLARAVTRPVRATIQQLGSVGAELLASTAQQAAGTQEQAAAVSQTVTTVDEVVQTADQTAQKARNVGEAIQRTHEVGKAGRKGLEDSLGALQAVQEKMESTAENILALAEQAQAIGEIIATVNDIAEQTNLLALNAAIEASRAGEHGLGFSVVASEVKALADQSKKATAQVRQILGEIQKATNTAVLSTEEVSKGVAAANRVAVQSGETIKALTDTLAEAAQAATHIVASAGQQSVGTAQIHQAMRNIDAVAKQSLAAVRQTEQAAQNLNALSNGLAKLIGN